METNMSCSPNRQVYNGVENKIENLIHIAHKKY